MMSTSWLHSTTTSSTAFSIVFYPLRQYDRRARLSDPWFDKECRDAKRLTRRLERAYTTARRRSARGSKTPSDSDPSARVASAKAAWYD